MNKELFPETLLVDIRHQQAFTTSLKVAAFFKKRHTEVLRAIAKLDCPEDFSRRNFALAEYRDKQKKPRPFYEISRDGFALLAMGFTGKEAMHWKVQFIDAFNLMEKQLAELTKREARALYFLRRHWKTVGDGVKAKLSRAAICAQTGHRSPNTITATKRRMRFFGLL